MRKAATSPSGAWYVGGSSYRNRSRRAAAAAAAAAASSSTSSAHGKHHSHKRGGLTSTQGLLLLALIVLGVLSARNVHEKLLRSEQGRNGAEALSALRRGLSRMVNQTILPRLPHIPTETLFNFTQRHETTTIAANVTDEEAVAAGLELADCRRQLRAAAQEQRRSEEEAAAAAAAPSASLVSAELASCTASLAERCGGLLDGAAATDDAAAAAAADDAAAAAAADDAAAAAAGRRRLLAIGKKAVAALEEEEEVEGEEEGGEKEQGGKAEEDGKDCGKKLHECFSTLTASRQEREQRCKEEEAAAVRASLRVRRKENSDVLAMDAAGKALEIKRLRALLEKLRTRYPDGTTQSSTALRDSIASLQAQKRNISEDVRVLQKKKEELEEATREGYAGLKSTGPRCTATAGDKKRYMNFSVGGLCPDDQRLVQRMLYERKCFALPRRRCHVITPAKPREPLVRPSSLFNQSALISPNVRWTPYTCKSFNCIAAASTAAAAAAAAAKQSHSATADTAGEEPAGPPYCGAVPASGCFNMSLEERWWRGTGPQRPASIERVLKYKPGGGIRIGIDIGGGTGGFAAAMARHNVTIVTTAANHGWGVASREPASSSTSSSSSTAPSAPYLETIALRGLMPLNLPLEARLPFYDGAMDLVHTHGGISGIAAQELNGLVYEWDRVLRVGGLLWLEMVTVPLTTSGSIDRAHIRELNKLRYRKLFWREGKTELGTEDDEEPATGWFTCVYEKTPNAGGPIGGKNQEASKRAKG